MKSEGNDTNGVPQYMYIYKCTLGITLHKLSIWVVCTKKDKVANDFKIDVEGTN